MTFRLICVFLALSCVLDANACSCQGERSLKGAYEGAKFLVWGKVIRKTQIPLAQTMQAEKLTKLKKSMDKDKIQLISFIHVTAVEVQVLYYQSGR